MFGCKFWLQIRLVLEAPDRFDSDSNAIVRLNPSESELRARSVAIWRPQIQFRMELI